MYNIDQYQGIFTKLNKNCQKRETDILEIEKQDFVKLIKNDVCDCNLERIERIIQMIKN